MENRREWISALVCFAAANAMNALIFAAITPIGWGLRGSTYEPGRPTPEDVRLGYAYDALFVAALVINLGVPIVCAGLRKWKTALGSVVAWGTVPFAWVVGVLIDFVVMRIASA